MPQHCVDWDKVLTGEEWETYGRVLADARAAGIRFALGGAFALATYTGELRKTKDLDIYVLPSDRERMIRVLDQAGLADYYERLPYDRGWIYRSHSGEVIVDVIWSMANRRASVDDRWLDAGPAVQIRGETFRMLPPEELVWGKLYVFQRDRCDWPDILNVLYEAGPAMNWEHLLERMGDDAPLLGSVLSIFGWLCPARIREFPDWVAADRRICLARQESPTGSHQRRVGLLNTRPWFTHSDREMVA